MTSLESIYEIKEAVLEIQKYLHSRDPVVLKKAKLKYMRLADRFLKENNQFVEPEQKSLCLNDADYFLSLLESVKEQYYFEDNGGL